MKLLALKNIIGLFFSLTVSQVDAKGWVETVSIGKDDGEGRGLGSRVYTDAIALSQDLLVTGSPYENERAGIIQIYDRKNYELLHEIPGDNLDDLFGSALDASASSNTIVVGAMQKGSDEEDGDINYPGFVKIFHYDRDVSGLRKDKAGPWIKSESMIEGSETDIDFGRSVAISDDGSVLCVGLFDKSQDNYSGGMKAYVLNEGNTDGEKAWEKIGDLLGKGGNGENSEYAYAIDIVQGKGSSPSSTNYYVAVGAPDYDEEKGMVEIYRISRNSDEPGEISMVQIGNLIVGENMGDHFGLSLSLGLLEKEGLLRLAVGVPSPDKMDEFGGHVAVFQYQVNDEDELEEQWERIDVIEELEEDDDTGDIVALSQDGKRLVITSPAVSAENGAVRIYDFNNKKMQFVKVGGNIVVGDMEEAGGFVAVDGLDVAVASGKENTVSIYRYSSGEGTHPIVPVFLFFTLAAAVVAILFFAVKKGIHRGFTWTRIREQNTNVVTTEPNVEEDGTEPRQIA